MNHLFFIYLAFLIPVLIININHGLHEFEEATELNANGETKSSIRTTVEGAFLICAAIGYIIATILIVIYPRNKIPYLAILIGTVIIVIIFYMRSTIGIQIPFTDIVIQKYIITTDIAITKIAEQILVIPIAMMLEKCFRKKLR